MTRGTSPSCGLCASMLVAVNGETRPNASGCREGWCGVQQQAWTPGPPPPRRPSPIPLTKQEKRQMWLAVGTFGLYPLARLIASIPDELNIRHEAKRYATRQAGRARYEGRRYR